MLAVVCSTMIAIICSSISSACLICITRSRWLRILCRGFCGVWLIWLCWFRIRRLWIYWSWICRLRRCGICWIWIRLTLIPSTRRRYWIWCRWFGRFWIYWLCWYMFPRLLCLFPVLWLYCSRSESYLPLGSCCYRSLRLFWHYSL